ncbi:GNAT family N-acetyltransferase [Fluctibacter halophilus]
MIPSSSSVIVVFWQLVSFSVMSDTTLRFTFCEDISALSARQWDGLAPDQPPFTRHGFLSALEHSNSVGPGTGWDPEHVLIWQDDTLIGCLPLYRKSHSYGEYVFDFAWANAYHHYQRDYYPKWVIAIPFTPVTCAKLRCTDCALDELLASLLPWLQQRAGERGISSIHWLFAPDAIRQQLEHHQWSVRHSVQFIWQHQGYRDMDDYLSRMTARRRKSIRKERQRVSDQGVQVSRLVGDDIRAEDWAFFYQCYRTTYRQRSGHDGYLTAAFFQQLADTMPDALMLVIARRDNMPVAAALYLFDDHLLCGRYWGAVEDIDALHFECCYYQGIEFCLERNIHTFNPGTQGEHKILRGFAPTLCYSGHWIADPAFSHAIGQANAAERQELQHYAEQAATLLPFKQDG